VLWVKLGGVGLGPIIDFRNADALTDIADRLRRQFAKDISIPPTLGLIEVANGHIVLSEDFGESSNRKRLRGTFSAEAPTHDRKVGLL